MPEPQADCPYLDEYVGAMCPDTLPIAYELQPYETIVTIVPPKRHNHSVFGTVRVDSIKILSITQKPNGIDYVCEPQRCVFKGGNRYCILVSGMPEAGTAGIYRPLINYKAWVTAYGVVDKIIYDSDSSLIFKVLPATVVKEKIFKECSFFQNGSLLSVELYSLEEQRIDLEIFNSTGMSLYRQDYVIVQGKNSIRINIEGFMSGIYFLRAISQKTNSVYKFFIQ